MFVSVNSNTTSTTSRSRTVYPFGTSEFTLFCLVFYEPLFFFLSFSFDYGIVHLLRFKSSVWLLLGCLQTFFIQCEPHRWRNGYRDHLECGRSWVRVPVGSYQRLKNWYGICFFSAKHTTLKSKSKDWIARNQDHVSEWSDMSIRGLFFQWASTIKIQLSVLV